MVKRLNANEIIELLNSSDAEALDDVTFEATLNSRSTIQVVSA